jgi:hypothetical protein
MKKPVSPKIVTTSSVRKPAANFVAMTVVFCVFFSFLYARSAETASLASSAESGIAAPTPTPTPKKNAKATPTPAKKAVKATPTPNKSKSTGNTQAKAKVTPTPKKPAANTKASNTKASGTKSTANTNKAANSNKNTNTKPASTSNTSANANAAKPKPAPKVELPKVIVTTTSARIRREANAVSTELKRPKLGTLLPALQSPTGGKGWYKVQYGEGAKTFTGWISATAVSSYKPSSAEQTYGQIAARNYKETGMTFSSAAELYEFLTKALPEIKTPDSAAELGLRRLQSLNKALRAIEAGKSNAPPYKAFLDAHAEELVYSEPAGEWYVNSSLIWEHHKKYSSSPIAEDIALFAAQNPLPGECEGYVNCYIYKLRATDGEYLLLYPQGKKAADALKTVTAFLEPIVADLKDKAVYNGPTDISDKAEFYRLIAELRSIVSKLPFIEKEKTLQQLNQLAEGYR